MPAGLLMETSRQTWIDEIEAPVQPAGYGLPPQFLPLRMEKTLSRLSWISVLIERLDLADENAKQIGEFER